ncbi:MAG: hypothetical protein ABIF82_12825, partial [Planctomycetota bacterium]
AIGTIRREAEAEREDVAEEGGRTNQGKAMTASEKHSWQGKLVAVQPRIKLLRSFDQRQHNYPGFILWIDGTVGGEERQFSVAVGRGAHAKHSFRIGDELSGQSTPVADPRLEVAEFYKTSRDIQDIQDSHRFPQISRTVTVFRCCGRHTYYALCMCTAGAFG